MSNKLVISNKLERMTNFNSCNYMKKFYSN